MVVVGDRPVAPVFGLVVPEAERCRGGAADFDVVDRQRSAGHRREAVAGSCEDLLLDGLAVAALGGGKSHPIQHHLRVCR